MYRVLIVDDEPWIAFGIANLIDWESFGFRVIGEAHNGTSAWELIERERPELVISDIRMPGLDGIKLLERICTSQLPTKVILVSGYADFVYAQQAIRYGAFEYLLKQIEKTKLEETVQRLANDLQSSGQASRELDMFLDDLFDLLEPDNRMTVGTFLDHRGLSTQFPHYRFLNCLFPESTNARSGIERKGRDKLQQIRFRTGQNKQSILLMYDELNDPLDFLTYISDNLADAQSIGISGLGDLDTPLSRLYQEADIAMYSTQFYGEERVARYKPMELSPDLRKHILHLEVAIKERNREQLASYINKFEEGCKQNKVSIDQVAVIYNQIVALQYKYGGRSGVAVLEPLTYESLARLHHTTDQLFAYLHDALENVTDSDSGVPSGLTKRILDYIDESFTQDMLLSDIARQFRISLGYVSSLIKRETGSTYTDYIADKRLNLARSLLSDSSLSIQEIVQRIGYKDYFHFNKLFKKHYGITPSKYRKL
ncbi:two-component system response regulator YesN [Paenibacillus cellulosilyticus]|uniref:Two-component system response regulator YesN n=1 Tax=Paenibacillus cellulosilyticus TaxID=375489 RepID=A0A2V2YVS1_9BACL|nr:response regulator [Paenibacillus cellulosilyticus]PWW02560.1 two-component system response regulator YesN [Paenibacillus cellulosilyticus]QKS47251.1 response regulator [Paenibacillus cellulosilyticus]